MMDENSLTRLRLERFTTLGERHAFRLRSGRDCQGFLTEVRDDAVLVMWAPSPFFAQATGTDAMSPPDEWIPLAEIELDSLSYWDNRYRRWIDFVEASNKICLAANITAWEYELLDAAYRGFNDRELDETLATMTADVTWPRAFKGDFVQGHEAIRAYWTEQWTEIDPQVKPVSFQREAEGRILVVVQQVVRDLAGNLLIDSQVGHRFTLVEGLIQGMEVVEL